MVSVRKSYAEVLKNTMKSNITGNDEPKRAYVAEKISDSNQSSNNLTDRSFFECCQTEGVPILCRQLCNLNAMINDQTKPYTLLCYNYLPKIFSCISDGRNHLPCCKRQNVPQLCQPSCTGKYTLVKALDHAICHEHSKTVLFCIAEGIEVLPKQPQDITAETVNSTYVSLYFVDFFSTF